MPNDLDELANRDPLSLSGRDIEDIINYYRQQRGAKPVKEGGPKVTIDLTKLGLARPKDPVKRRV